MNKRLLLKVFVLCVLFCQLVNRANAQYAVGGTASADLQKSVYWLTWNPGTFGLSGPGTVGNVVNGTYTWQYSNTVRIQAVISDPTTATTQVGNLVSYTPGTYVAGDGLDLMYSGNNGTKGGSPASLGVARSALATVNAGFRRFNIAITVQLLINGSYQSVDYPGMVIADAEALAWAASAPDREYFSAKTNGPTAWQLLNFRIDPTKSLGALGGNNLFGVKWNQDHYVMDQANSGKDITVRLTSAAGHDPGVQAVMYADGATALSDVTLKGNGITALAIGFVLPFDLGDAPASYGRPENYITSFTFGSAPISNGSGTGIVLKTIATTPGGMATLTPKAKAYMGASGGANNVDGDGDNGVNTNATTDNGSINDDEDALSPAVVSALNIKVNQPGNVTLTIPSIVNNETTGLGLTGTPVPVYLDGWIDFNQDGKFTENERATSVTIGAGQTVANTNLVFSQTKFTGNIKMGSNTFARLRLSKNILTDWDATTTTVDDASTSSADGGETEDYKLNNITGVVISGNVFSDGNGATGGISGTALNTLGVNQLYAYLVDNATSLIVQKVAVAGGSYTFTGVNNGTYRVAIAASNNPVIGGNISTIPLATALPSGWTASVDGYGTNNTQDVGGTGIDATTDLRVLITPAINGNDVTDVNFGINAHPVAVNDLAIPANTNTATSKNLVTNDTDADGTVNAATVVIENPANPGVYAATGFTTTDGTYAINASTGVVTFTSANAFTGTTSPAINYRVQDNFGSISNTGTFSFTVKIGGVADTYTTPVNTAISLSDVRINDGTAANTGTVTVTPTATSTQGGTVAVNGSGLVTYTPASDFIGTDTYTYTLTKNAVVSDPITVTVTVKPAGVADTYTTPINTALSLSDVRSNDGTAANTGTVTVTPTATSTQGGTVVVNGSGLVTYTPANNFVGTDTYTYTLTKNALVSDAITVTVTVKPTGVADTYTTPINTALSLSDVRSNDGTAANTGTVTVTPTATSTQGGTVAVNGSGLVTYTPANNFIGTDTYTYTLTKNGAVSDAIQVTVTVKPKGVDDIVSTDINTPVATVVTTNDGISGSTPVTVTSGTLPTHGTILVSGTTITYTPSTGYVGSDTYTYTLTKNTIVSDPITVFVNVGLAGTPDNGTTTINTPVPTVVTTNDGVSGIGATVTAGNGSNGTTTVSGSTVTYTPNPTFIGVDTYTYTLTKNSATSAPITVTITVKPKGTNDVVSTVINTQVTTAVTANDGASGATPVTVTASTLPAHGNIVISGTSITYTPNNGYLGSDAYTYTLTKNTLVSDPITVSITVTPPAPVGVDDSDLTPVNTPVSTNVIANDGTSGTGAIVVSTAGSNGTTAVSGGDVTYTPANGYIGTDTYTYTLTKSGVTSAPITVTINVYSAAMTLSKVANNGATKAGDVINYTLIVKNTGSVTLTNIAITDPGADAGSISPTSITSLASGASATVTANHTVVAADVTAGKFSNQATVTGKDPKSNTVTKISDDPGTSTVDDPTIVPITPVGAASINLAKTGTFTGNQVNYTFIITNNGGVALNTITLTDTKLGLNGVTIAAPAGGLLPNQSLTYNATYTLTQADKDLGNVSNTATVNAKDPGNNTVTGVGSTLTTVTTSPIAINDAAETNIGTPVIISVLTNDNPKSSTFNLTSIEILSNPMHGTVVTNANGTITYTPTAGYTGTDSFTYRVKDAYGYYTNTATVTVTTNLVVELKIPTLFSPNGDGVNDGFVIKDLADYAQNELIVLNRWGNEVYRQPNYQNNWSGTGLNEGTYFYIVRLKKANGDSWVIKKGYVTLIRTFKK